MPGRGHKGANDSITAKELRRILRYDPKTGIFTWLVALSRRAPVGKKAGWTSTSNTSWTPLKRTKIGIRGTEYVAGRLAWLYMTGKWPRLEIDHIDGDGCNNRWDNLREATPTQNMINRKAQSNNTSGQKGVFHNKKSKRFWAYVSVDRRRVNLGRFLTFDEAKIARLKAEKKFYGEFNNTKQ